MSSTAIPDAPRIMKDWKRELRQDLYTLYFRAKYEVEGPPNTRFAELVDTRDPIAIVERFILGKPSHGFTSLIAAGRADITMEFMICDPANAEKQWWDEIPSEFRQAARSRLAECGVVMPGDTCSCCGQVVVA